MDTMKIRRVLLVTLAPLALLAQNAQADCAPWDTACFTLDTVVVSGSNYPTDEGWLDWLWPNFGSHSGGQLPGALTAALNLRDDAEGRFNDLCYASNESPSEWMARVVGLTVAEHWRNSALVLAVREIATANAGASSFSNLTGMSNVLFDANGVATRTLSPRPC